MVNPAEDPNMMSTGFPISRRRRSCALSAECRVQSKERRGEEKIHLQFGIADRKRLAFKNN